MMNNIEEGLLNRIISYSAKTAKNGFIASYLLKCELHIDQLNSLYNYIGRNPILLTFKFSYEDLFDKAISDKKI
jgi:hypothetical protein